VAVIVVVAVAEHGTSNVKDTLGIIDNMTGITIKLPVPSPTKSIGAPPDVKLT